MVYNVYNMYAHLWNMKNTTKIKRAANSECVVNFWNSPKMVVFSCFYTQRQQHTKTENQRTLIMCAVNKFTTVNIIKPSDNALWRIHGVYTTNAEECESPKSIHFTCCDLNTGKMVKWHVNSFVSYRHKTQAKIWFLFCMKRQKRSNI